ncbi:MULTISPECIES: putative nucleotidyltransferase substrate binding domain-containing protein [Sulfurimonas]|uniref:putative nucleotidyltransferase substrate binding domain-containing protein n=1 Tax=Sulfurimonas TaxID=202746 RepID=UPI001263E98C|nr:putative nucleotidyltransferase substrate binding domain-containing protein [Sulfurimonas indica]
MSILDQRELIASIHPFGQLSSRELDALMKKIDIAYYTKDTLLISKDIESIAFYIVIKGTVHEYIDEQLHNVYSHGDSFDADALIYGKTESRFVVDEDLICYEIKKEDFLDLMQNKKIQSYFLQDFISRHKHLKEFDSQSDLTPFLMAKVSEIFLHKACIVDADVSIYEALQEQTKLQAKVIIVQEEDEYYIVTDTDLREKVLLESLSTDEKIIKIASNKIITIESSDFLFNALLIMTHKGIKRLVVTEDEKIIGVLEQLDLLSYFASHSHLVAVQIQKAKSIDELKSVSEDIKNLIVMLRAKGVKVRYITKLVSALNEKIYKKVFEMSVSKELLEKCSLIVMGSEGRAEQTIKTDQDNALVIDDNVNEELFVAPMEQLNAYLLELGFPTCKGNVMVSNPFWRKSLHDFKGQIEEWSNSLDEKELQNLSIFLDAKSVAGDETYLQTLRNYLYENFSQREDVLAHLAKAVLNFETPLSLFSGFVLEKEHNNKLDLKKGGLFAIVHGVRVLALQYEIDETNTVERIKALNNKGIIDKNFAEELIESFDTISSIRLITLLEAKELEEENYINPKNLSKNQRDLLKDSFKVVNKFKKFMNFHFHLNMVV